MKFLTVTERFAPFAEELAEKFKAAGIRAVTDLRNEKIGYKIREARNERTPVYRHHRRERTGIRNVCPSVPAKKEIWDRFRLEELIEKLVEEIRTKKC